MVMTYYMLSFYIQEVDDFLSLVCANEQVFLMPCKRNNLAVSVVVVSLLTIILS